jgi:hypothetical protein
MGALVYAAKDSEDKRGSMPREGGEAGAARAACRGARD